MKFIVSIVLVLSCCTANAQLPNFKWKMVLDGYNDVWIADLVVDKDGNTYAGVNYTAPLKVPGLEKQQLPYPGHVHGLIIKINANGKAVWAHPFKSGFDNRINDIALAPNGDLLITGFGDGVLNFPGLHDTLKVGKAKAPDYYRYYQGFYAARYSPEGERKWVQYYDTPWGEGTSIAENSKGMVYLGFYYTSVFKQHDVVIDTVTDRTLQYRYGIARLNGSDGKMIDHRKMKDQPSGTSSAVRTHLLFDAQDNLLMYGFFNRRIDITPTDSLTNDGYWDGNDSYIAKLNPAGKLLWVKKVSGQSTQAINGLCLGADNSIYATGTYDYECILGDGVNVIQKSKFEYKSGSSFFYLHLFEDGEADFIRYEDSKGYSSYFNGDAIALDPYGNAHITGYFTDTLHIDGLQAATWHHNYTALYSKWNGNELKKLGKVGTTPHGSLFARQISINKQVYAIGGAYYGDSASLLTDNGSMMLGNKDHGNNAFIVGGLVEQDKGVIAVRDVRKERLSLVKTITACITTSTPAADVWIPMDTTKRRSACGDEIKGMEVSLFPNPTNREVKIRFTGITGMTQVEIFSDKGQLVLSHRLQDVFEGQVVTFDLQGLSDGTYVVRITHKDFQKGLRVVKVR